MGKGRDLGRRVRRPQSVDEKLRAAKRKDERKLKINRQGTLDFHLNAQPAQRKKCGACDAADVEVEDSLCKGCEAAIIAAEASRGSSSADPSYGSIANMASVAAVGEIVDLTLASWLPPVGLELTASDVSKLCFVKIDKIRAPALLIPQ